MFVFTDLFVQKSTNKFVPTKFPSKKLQQRGFLFDLIPEGEYID